MISGLGFILLVFIGKSVSAFERLLRIDEPMFFHEALVETLKLTKIMPTYIMVDELPNNS